MSEYVHPTTASVRLLANRGLAGSLALRLTLTIGQLFLMLASANLASPLFPLIREHVGTSAFGITIAYSTYVVAFVVALLLMRARLGTWGAQRVLLLAGWAAVVAAVLIAYADDLMLFCAARAVQGVALAAATGAAADAVASALSTRASLASRLLLLVGAGGVAAGPVLGGLLSDVGEPLQTPFIVVGVAVGLITGAGAAAHPWQRMGGRRRVAGRGGVGRAPSRRRLRAYWRAALTGFCSYALFGFALAVTPSLVASVSPTDVRALIGLLCSLTLITSAVVQVFALTGRAAYAAGMWGMSGGLAIVAIGSAAGSLPCIVVGLLLAGAGQGAAFQSAFAEALASVPAESRADDASGIYALSYLGSAVPILCLGLLTDLVGITAAVATFASILAAASCVLAAARRWRRSA